MKTQRMFVSIKTTGRLNANAQMDDAVAGLMPGNVASNVDLEGTVLP